MASLTAHLVESGGHGRLDFHPSCPVCCRERLFGSLAYGAVVSRRTQAALASGVLALSAAGPPVAMAQEPDQQLEGGSGAGQPQGGGETGSGAVVAPGSDSSAGTVPPTEVVPPAAPDLDPLTPPDTDDGSLLQEVVPVDTEPIEVPSTSPAPPPRVDEDGAPEAGPVLPQPAPEPGIAEPDSPAEAPEQLRPPAEAEGSEALDSPEPSAPTEHPADTVRPKEAAEPKPRVAPQPSAADTPTAPAEAEPVGAPSAEEPVQIAPASDPASTPAPASTPQGRFLVVQPGDSLWAIAKRLLGPHASPAEIARKVNRLWELNRERIGTGRPDLLLVGTKLRLR
jgi:LysM domain